MTAHTFPRTSDVGVGGWIGRRARMNPGSTALRQGDRSYTYAALARRVDDLARGLLALGVRRGDRVAHLAANDIAGFELLFASTRIGAIFVPLNIRLAAPEIAVLMEECAPSVVFHDEQRAGALTGDQRRILINSEAYEDVFAKGAGAGTRIDPVGLDDDAVILFTSGTTGRPKGAVLTHGNITWNTVNQLASVDVLASDVALCVAPLFHASGLCQVGLPTLWKGGTVVVSNGFDPAGLLRTVAEEGITAFGAVPTMLQVVCAHPDWPDADLSSLRYIIYGGSPARAEVASQWSERGVTVLQGYGMTEASPGVLLASPAAATEDLSSPGTAHMFVDVALLDQDGVVREASGTGELLIAGPNLFKGYWNRPEETSRTFVEGWFRTGDIVDIDVDGRAHVRDRVGDVFISGGENVHPAEVEVALNALPGVFESAVVGVPDEQWGEVGAAFVVALPGHSLDPDELRAALDGVLARYKIPRYAVIVDGLPRTATGKVCRTQLRQESAGQRFNSISA